MFLQFIYIYIYIYILKSSSKLSLATAILAVEHFLNIYCISDLIPTNMKKVNIYLLKKYLPNTSWKFDFLNQKGHWIQITDLENLNWLVFKSCQFIQRVYIVQLMVPFEENILSEKYKDWEQCI